MRECIIKRVLLHVSRQTQLNDNYLMYSYYESPLYLFVCLSWFTEFVHQLHKFLLQFHAPINVATQTRYKYDIGLPLLMYHYSTVTHNVVGHIMPTSCQERYRVVYVTCVHYCSKLATTQFSISCTQYLISELDTKALKLVSLLLFNHVHFIHCQEG